MHNQPLTGHEYAVAIESYVVRIYRRGRARRRSIMGVIEATGSGWQKPFQSFEELAEILAQPHTHSRRSGSGKSDSEEATSD